MPFDKPSTHLNWTDGDPSKVEEPSSSKKALGYVANERPIYKHHNWLWYMCDQWHKYFETVTDQYLAEVKHWDAVVATSGGTHTTLQAAINDVNPYSRILIIDAQQLSSTVSIAKVGISLFFHPRAEITNDGAGTGISITASDVSIYYGIFKNFTIAIDIGSSALRCRIHNCYFAGNTTNIQNASSLTLFTNNFPLTENTPLGGGGGGGSAVWHEPQGEAPIADEEFQEKVYFFETGQSQKLVLYTKVPPTYLSGKPITLKVNHYTSSTTGTQLLKARTYLIRQGVDAINSLANYYDSTNSAIVNSTAYLLQTSIIDLTNPSGQINDIDVSAGNLLKIELTRGNDTDTDDIRFIPNSTELIYI